MFRCQVCRKRTEDIDTPPCNPANHVFKPQKITTLHKFDYLNGYITVRCTGQPPTPNMEGLGSNFGINCIRCRTKMKEDTIRQNSPKEEVLLSRDLGKAEESTKLTEADKLSTEDTTSS